MTINEIDHEIKRKKIISEHLLMLIDKSCD